MGFDKYDLYGHFSYEMSQVKMTLKLWCVEIGGGEGGNVKKAKPRKTLP